MRTVFILLIWFCFTNSLPSKEAPDGAMNKTLARVGLHGANQSINVKTLKPQKGLKNGTTSQLISPGTSSSNKALNGTFNRPKLNATTESLNSSGANIVSKGISGAPVHEIIQESLKPQHMGREHVVEQPLIGSSTISGGTMENTTKNTTVPNQNHVVVPKKGVSIPATDKVIVSSPTVNNVNALNVFTNATVVHKKPLILESDSDNYNEQPVDLSKEASISIAQIDPALLHSKPKRADYIIPIIGVIFSVPVVAFLISLVYKRGSDWWRYRNYKRMDFLIEGMYQ